MVLELTPTDHFKVFRVWPCMCSVSGAHEGRLKFWGETDGLLPGGPAAWRSLEGIWGRATGLQDTWAARGGTLLLLPCRGAQDRTLVAFFKCLSLGVLGNYNLTKLKQC